MGFVVMIIDVKLNMLILKIIKLNGEQNVIGFIIVEKEKNAKNIVV
jgi:hypothetical protein